MLLNIYLGTTVISWIVTIIFSIASDKKIRRDGYKFVVEKKSVSEKIANLLSTLFWGSIPIYNILNTIFVLFIGDKVYEHVKDDLLDKGKIIYMPTEERSINEESKTNTEDIEKASIDKKYDEMTLEEKLAYLEQERELLLSQSDALKDQRNQNATKGNLSKNQQGPILKIVREPKQK